MAAPKIVAAPSRGAYVVKGTPGGITIPKAPTAGMAVTGKKGTEWVYRPKGPGGAGWYAKKPGTSKAPAGPSPAVTGGSGAAGTTTTTTTTFKPDAAWWSAQFSADPRWLQAAPSLRAREEGTAASYGYNIARNSLGQPLFKSASKGISGITQAVDDKGNPLLDDNGAFIYKDAQGNTYSPSDLQMDIRRIERGQAGYLQGQLGAAEAESEQRQYGIGNVAAQSGARRSGMRAQASDAETRALQGALSNLATRAGGEFSGIQSDYLTLYNQIFGDLLKEAGNTPAATVTTETPAAAAETPSATTVPGGGSVNAAGQYTPPAAGSALSPQAFNNTLDEIIGPASQRGPQPMSKASRIKALRNLYDSYQLTPQQRNRVKNELKKLGFVIR